ncbi:hypothetical protein L6V77_24840 [Myxococcota bacterium]|nr:hypothetical protein [Myxococcota bacterium]
MIRSLGDLRARRKGGTGKKTNSWVFEAAFAAIGWTSLALAIAAGVSGGWLTGTVALFLGFVALCLVFILGGGLSSAFLPEKPAEALGFAAATAAVGFYSHDRYGALSLVPPAVAVLMFVLHGLQYGRAEARTAAATRRRDLPADVEEMLVGLPEHLDARLRGPVDRALADCAALKAAIEALTTTEAEALPLDLEPKALVRDAHTALREMARRAAAAQALVEALRDAPSAPVETALAAAVRDLDAQANEVRGAREAWLLFQAARVGDRVAQVDGLRRRAEALRAMGQAMGEVERVH